MNFFCFPRKPSVLDEAVSTVFSVPFYTAMHFMASEAAAEAQKQQHYLREEAAYRQRFPMPKGEA